MLNTKVYHSFDELIELVKKNYHKPDLEVIGRAYHLAESSHVGKKRYTGHDYIVHPLATAYKLAEMKLGINCIVAGLLHDVVEDTDVSIQRLEEEFGDDVAKLVDAVTKLKKVKYTGSNIYAENMRRMFLAMAEDVRVVFIKFADRLHNLQTLYTRPQEKQQHVAKEVLEIYAPIANRLGMGEMRGDLEDLAFSYADPKAYQQVKTELERTLLEKEKVVASTIKTTRQIMGAVNIKAPSVHGRVKRIYSLYKKLQRYNNDLKKIYDVVAVRIIVEDVSDCYTVLGLLHMRWKPLAGRIKDYISQPKPNGYQSLHTTVFAEHGAIVEFQIRTQEMHELAEYGVAAHWRFKEGGQRTKAKDTKWMDELAQTHKIIKANEDFLGKIEKLKLEVFKDRVFVFTPKGDVIDLPENSTPIDFAYAIHTDVGNKCTGSRINDKMVNLDTELQSGDMCEIIVDKNRKGPNADWLKFAKTNQARSRIRDATRSTVRIWIDKMTSNKKTTKKKT